MEMKSLSILKWALVFILTAAAGIYFRLYPVLPASQPNPEKIAKVYLEQTLAAQVEKSLPVHPGMTADDKTKQVREQVRRMIDADPARYRKTYDQMLHFIRLKMPPGNGRKYLLEADPYYYYHLTRKIEDTGRLSSEMRQGKFFNSLKHAPFGSWITLNLHPYAGWYLSKAAGIFLPQADLMERLCWVPLILTLFAAAAFALAASALGAGAFAYGAGALAFLLAPIFVQRSSFGWYDTDPYNYFFPFSILAMLFWASRKPAQVLIFAAAAGILTGVYSVFWEGWPFIMIVMPAAAMCAWAAALFLRVPAEDRKVLPVFTGFYLLFSAVCAAVFLSPSGLWGAVQSGWSSMQQFALVKTDYWPNIFLTVGEAHGISFKKLIYLAGNYLTFGVAALGLLDTLRHFFKTREGGKIIPGLVLSAVSVPLLVMSLRTERFAVLFVIPLSLWTVFGASVLRNLLAKGIAWIFGLRKMNQAAEYAGGFIFLLLFLPPLVLLAHISALGLKPIMDSAWYESMQDIREKTREDAIVSTWWPPGYFIMSLAERGVNTDGGTQHLRESYWLARIFSSEDEREAAGLLRMIDLSGNEALEYLQNNGMDTADAVDLLVRIAPLSREEALKFLPAQMSSEAKSALLDKTHGGKVRPPAYVMVYSDLIEKNLALTMIARWDFRKARAMKAQAKNYALSFAQISGPALKYMPEAALERKQGDFLFFKNGLAVSLSQKDAFINLPDKKIKSRPASFFYMENGTLKEKKFSDAQVGISALLFRGKDGAYQSVLADAPLIRSLLFRLYYLKAEGLNLFKPFTAHSDPSTGNYVAVYENKQEPV